MVNEKRLYTDFKFHCLGCVIVCCMVELKDDCWILVLILLCLVAEKIGERKRN